MGEPDGHAGDARGRVSSGIAGEQERDYSKEDGERRDRECDVPCERGVTLGALGGATVQDRLCEGGNGLLPYADSGRRQAFTLWESGEGRILRLPLF